MSLYPLVRNILFSIDSEQAHHLFLGFARTCAALRLTPLLKQFVGADDPRLKVRVCGLEFSNPIGLAAGFDKDAKAGEFLAALGFGHLEFGSVTAQPQSGNPKPRIFRLPKEGALINRMGFPSEGARVVARRLAEFKASNSGSVIGVNLGKTKIVEIDNAKDDYLESYELLRSVADYFVLNISSPNTPQLRELQSPERLKDLLTSFRDRQEKTQPIFLKIAPDLSFAEIDSLIDVVKDCKVDGIIATNTTLSRDGIVDSVASETGGLSGIPLFQKSIQIVRHISKRSDGKLAIIAVGGISNGDQAFEMLQAGAHLVQIYTSFIYQGPWVVSAIKKRLIQILDEKKISSIEEIHKRAEAQIAPLN